MDNPFLKENLKRLFTLLAVVITLIVWAYSHITWKGEQEHELKMSLVKQNTYLVDQYKASQDELNQLKAAYIYDTTYNKGMTFE